MRVDVGMGMDMRAHACVACARRCAYLLGGVEAEERVQREVDVHRLAVAQLVDVEVLAARDRRAAAVARTLGRPVRG